LFIFSGVQEVAALSFTDWGLIIHWLIFFNGVHEVAALSFTDFCFLGLHRLLFDFTDCWGIIDCLGQ